MLSILVSTSVQGSRSPMAIMAMPMSNGIGWMSTTGEANAACGLSREGRFLSAKAAAPTLGAR